MDLLRCIFKRKYDGVLEFCEDEMDCEYIMDICIKFRWKEGLVYLMKKKPLLFKYTETYKDPKQYYQRLTTLELACVPTVKHKRPADLEIVRLLLKTGYFGPSFPDQCPLNGAIFYNNYLMILEWILLLIISFLYLWHASITIRMLLNYSWLIPE